MKIVVPYETHDGATIAFVGRDPGAQEERAGRPFVGDAGDQLMRAIAAAGHKRADAHYLNTVCVRPLGNDFAKHAPDDVTGGVAQLNAWLKDNKPNLTVALGNEASWATVADWPSKHGRGIMGATAIEQRRGYLWLGRHGGKVLTTLHPSAVMRDASGISEMLFNADIERAFAESASAALNRPKRIVEVCKTVALAEAAAEIILRYGRAAADIEITAGPDHRCDCIGFAVSAAEAYVFPIETLSYAFDLLRSPALELIWQNAQFDLHFLQTRHNVHASAADDTIVMWHTLWPEMAGRAQDDNKRGSKRTHKGLAFLASLYCNVEWYKDYDFKTIDDKYRLCGLDVCVTYEIADALLPEIAAKGLTYIYRETLKRIPPVVMIQARGLLIDEPLRAGAAAQLELRRVAAVDELRSLAEPILTEVRDKLSKPALIWGRQVCACCRNGAGKRERCWSCEGLDKMPKKPELLALAQRNVRQSAETPQAKAGILAALNKLKAVDLVAYALRPCAKCHGQGAWETFDFNPASDEQMHMLLFEALKLPHRASVDEASLKSLLGALS